MDPQSRRRRAPADGVTPVRWVSRFHNFTRDPSLCTSWGTEEPVRRSERPTVAGLFVAGELDVEAPPRYTVDVAGRSSKSQVVVIDDGGPPLFLDPCVADMVARYLSDPSATVVATCS